MKKICSHIYTKNNHKLQKKARNENAIAKKKPYIRKLLVLKKTKKNSQEKNKITRNK